MSSKLLRIMKFKSYLRTSLHFVHGLKVSAASISTNQFHNSDTQVGNKKIHKYRDKWKFENVETTSKYLLEHVIYHQDGVVAINKPPDLGSSKTENSIYHSLPYLAKELNYKYLKLVIVPEGSVSGVTVLAGNASIADRIKKALRRSKSIYADEPKQNFLAVTIGHPIEKEGSERCGVTIQFKGKEKYCLISRHWHKNAVKRREVNIGTVAHKTLSQSELASLISVSTWQVKHHCPRLYLSDLLLAPALGDQIFSPRAGSLFGKPILLKPWLAPAVKALPEPFLKKLYLRSGSEGLVPLHFHLNELTLHNFLGANADLTIRAEPPDYFRWTCEQLGLELPKATETQLPTQLLVNPQKKELNRYCASMQKDSANINKSDFKVC